MRAAGNDDLAPVADALVAELPALVDALDRRVLAGIATTHRWTTDERVRVRVALAEVAAGFVRYLRVGDLEANTCERLRRLAAAPLPGTTPETTAEVVRALRTEAVAHIAGRVGDDRHRAVDRALEDFLALLRSPESLTAPPGSLDGWLARIADDGRDADGQEQPRPTAPDEPVR